ncbi:MAG: hypothetical protein R3F07_01325 [Opitutaceae bacterium]
MVHRINRKSVGAVTEYSLLLLGFVILFDFQHWVVGDGKARFDALSSLLEKGTFADTKYSIIGPLFSTPLYYAGKWLQSPEWWCARYNSLIVLVGFSVQFSILRSSRNEAFLRRFLLVLLIGSNIPYHQVHYYGEVFTAFMVAIGIIAICQDRPIRGWIAVILGVANTPASLVGMVIVSLILTFRTRELRHLFFPVIAGGLVLLENTVTRGSPFASGYALDVGFTTIMPYSGRPGFSFPFYLGLLSILFSFGKGLVWYFPGLLVPVQKDVYSNCPEMKQTFLLWIGFLVGLVLVYAKWWAWYGGAFWGPRFFLFASFPASFAIASNLLATDPREGGRLLRDFLVLMALFWSIWVGLSGLVFHHRHLLLCFENNCALEMLCWYVPEFSPLFRPFVVSDPLRTKEMVALVFGLVLAIYLGAGPACRLSKQIWLNARNLGAGLLNRKWRF